MEDVLSRYSSFFTSSFWSLQHLRVFGGTKVPLNASFVKNFSNRFLVGTSSTRITSDNNADASDNFNYQLKLVLRKMYVNRRNVFIYLNSNTGASFTDFVYFFFYKQSKYWYNYKATYIVPNFFLLPAFAKSSNFLDINLLDRVYFKPNCHYLWVNKGRFNVYAGGRFNVGRLSARAGVVPLSGWSQALGSFKENFGTTVQSFSLIGRENITLLPVETQTQMLHFSGAHSWTNPPFPFFQLKIKIVQVGGGGRLCNVVFKRCLFLPDLRHGLNGLTVLPIRDGKSRNSIWVNTLSGGDIYYFWWLEGVVLLQSCIFELKRPSAQFFSLLMTNFYKLMLPTGVEIGELCYGTSVYYSLRLGEIGGFAFKFSQKALGSLTKHRVQRHLHSRVTNLDAGLRWGLHYQLLARISQIILMFYFTDFGSSTDIFNSWRFKETRRVVLRITSVSMNYKLANQEMHNILDISSSLLLQFFVFFIVSKTSPVSFFTASLPRLTGVLLYFRRFLKSFGQYNALLVIFLRHLAPCMTPDFGYSLVSLSFKLRGRGFLVNWAYLLAERSDLSSVTANLNETSHRTLSLMQLGGTRNHYEFFSLYSGRSLSWFSEANPTKNWSKEVYSSDVKESLNLEFFDTLSAWVFNKTSFNTGLNNLTVPASFDIGINLQLALEVQGTWFFNEFDVIDFTSKPSCFGTSNKDLLIFSRPSSILFLPLLLKMRGWKKNRQRCTEQFSGVWVADPRRRIWSDSSPEVLAHKVLIFRREPVKAVWQPKCALNLMASVYWYHNFELTFFRL